jgi:two-component sensor histidine kinase/ligand-binding sensor protein
MEGKDEPPALALRDLVDMVRLQSMADHLYAAGGIPVGILDLEGNVLVGAGWQDICTRFHRENPSSRRRCLESDAYIGSRLNQGGVLAYKCRNMLWDLALPIKIGGNHLGTLFVGQFFYEGEARDYEAFERQAEEYGFEWAEYRAALDRVPTFSRGRVADMMEYYRLLVDELASSGLAILELRRTEERLQASLLEKEALLKEVHHRVKNNLNVIVSLLGLQIGSDPEHRDILAAAQGRVFTISQIYDSLYRQGDISRIELGDYLRHLAHRVGSLYDEGGLVTAEVSTEPVEMGVGAAANCGLAVCELLTNAYKHAFGGGTRRGRLILSARAGSGEIEIIVADDGPGATPQALEGSSGSLGLAIVRGLIVDQLKGRVTFANQGGLRCAMAFPFPAREESGA